MATLATVILRNYKMEWLHQTIAVVFLLTLILSAIVNWDEWLINWGVALLPWGTMSLNTFSPRSAIIGPDFQRLAKNSSVIVVGAGAFGGFKSIAPGSWIEIYGANLGVASRGWTDDDMLKPGRTNLSVVDFWRDIRSWRLREKKRAWWTPKAFAKTAQGVALRALPWDRRTPWEMARNPVRVARRNY